MARVLGEPDDCRWAKGLWNGCPETPFTKCGTAFARNAPPKKYAM
jgi:hypothetical protein